ncbi:hypothetical protein A4H97_34060 [Niastella yeongjuensis]|uniref:RHS repeat-associated core domain-containing protein n=1 Tax=Niastella yeongjuensis TaxID=354355 RepID=A0A1V9EB53_9BACT|nr:RHS repeat-associated core domain-containing protein [Niastella yeongjuensis]OQP43336.1 hypothetical protein A4H97_34060 [Niastella yeongjuensis]SEP47765.1 RHS repeat-associated core domain-containing protein [Niastella yeongjuensis]
MKRLLLLVTFSILCLFSFSQTNVQQDPRVNQILKGALASQSSYYIFGRTTASAFINIAVLNQSSHTLCWFTCHGRLFDSTKLTNQEFELVTSKLSDPFVLYQNICDKYLADIAAAKDIYRVYGDVQLFDKLNGNYRALFAMERVQAAKTPLQKLIAIENIRKKILTQLAYLNCVSPLGLHDDPLYKISKEQAGAMIQTKDSTVYYNIDPTSAIAKISLFKKSAGQLYIQNRFSEIIDSVAIQPEKYDLLQKEKTDVFLLYRGWLELQFQGTLSAIRRQSAGLYNQVSVQNEKEVKELYNQLNANEAKINQLNSPEVKSIEQAVYETYKNEISEIAYMPLLGIAYELIEKRGQKEYELTNHLGNVLVTVTDKKIGVSSPSDSSLIDHYEPDIVSAQDYYPFGMLQPGRSYLSPNGDEYRYGFNGKENDNEVKGEGNQQDYGMRVYDPRVAKFISVDPLYREYPWNSSYAYAENSPILFNDLDGLERVNYLKTKENGKAVLKPINTTDVYVWTWKPHWGGTKLGFTLWELVKNLDKKYVTHEPTEGTVEKFDKVQFVTYDQTVSYDSYEDMVKGKNGSSGHERSKFYLAKGMQNAREENMANGGGGMYVNLYKIPKFTIDPKKFEYFFGRVVEGSEHNIVRSAQNLKDLTTLGIKTEGQLMKVFDEAISLEGGVVKSNKFGTSIIKTVQIGDKGAIDVTFFYENGNMNALPKVSTLIPKIAKATK